MIGKPEFDHRIDIHSTRSADGIVDGLNRQPIARLLAKKLLDEDEMVVGLYGTWGSGKSFVLDLTIEELFRHQRRPRPIVCYFQPWAYEPDVSLAPGMIMSLQSVQEQFPGLNPDLTPEGFEKVRQKAEDLWRFMRRAVSLLKPVAQGAAAGLAAMPPVLPGQQFAAAAASAVGTALAGAPSGDPIGTWDPARIRSKMADLIAALRISAAKGDKERIHEYRVVVVIDDLDRCGPDLMVDMLNWLKVHLSVEGCSFLLALDHEAAARAIVGRYREYLGDAADVAYGLRYLEKIVEFEVELGRSDLVEQMAAGALEARTRRVEEIVEQALDRQGVRSREITQLIRLPTLQSPRTMLKVVNRFRDVLAIVRQEHQDALGSLGDTQLPVDYPFWLLLIVAMYYRLAPGYIEAFCYGRRPLAGAVAAQGSDEVPQPVREFDEFLELMVPADGESSRAPGPGVLINLYSTVRQLAVP